MLGIFSAGFDRTQYLIKHVRLDDKATYLKLQSATRGLRIAGHLGNICGMALSATQVKRSGFSNESLVRFGVDGAITIVGLFNPYGLPIGYTVALVLGSMNDEGRFDSFYNKFSKEPF